MQHPSPSPGSQLALVQLPGRMRRALKLYRKITGLTAVTSVATSLPERGKPFALSPPVHPRCAKKLRSIPNAPCGEQWSIHLRSGRRSLRTHSHTCPLGMRCSCVPVRLGDQLVGVAKLVVDAETPDPALKTALSVLQLVVSETCQGFAASMLAEEARALRQRVTELQRVQSKNRPQAADGHMAGAALVDRALAHLQRHYHEPALSLRSVASAVRCNPRYLTARFTQIVGEHMHAHLLTLRVSHACRLLLSTELRVKEIAFASGFSTAGRLASAFRTHVGVPPGEYRRIFAAP